MPSHEALHRDHRRFLAVVTQVRRAVGGHPLAPQPDEAVAALKALEMPLRHHFQEEHALLPALRGRDPAMARRMEEDHARILAWLRRLPEGRTGLLEGHGLARDLREHMRWEEAEVLPLLRDAGRPVTA